MKMNCFLQKVEKKKNLNKKKKKDLDKKKKKCGRYPISTKLIHLKKKILKQN